MTFLLLIFFFAVGRDTSPGLQWHKEYTPESKMNPRVLMIDYLQRGSSFFFFGGPS